MIIRKLKENKVVKYIGKIIKRCAEHDSSATSGYVTYKLLISAVPLAIVVAALFSGVPSIERWLMESLQPILAPQAYAFVKYISEMAGANATTPILSIGMAVMLYTASSGMFTLMRGVSIAEDGRGAFEKRGFLKNRILAIILTLIIFVIILCCGLISLELKYYKAPDSQAGRDALSYAFMIIMLVVTLMFIYKISPVKKTYWLVSLKRALLSSVMIAALTFAMNIYYTEFSNLENVYGAFAGLAIIMIWIYSISFCILAAGEV